MSSRFLSKAQFPYDEVVDVPVSDLQDAYFHEHDVHGADVEQGYTRRLRENQEWEIGPGHPEYHPGDDPEALDALTESIRQHGVQTPLEMVFGAGHGPTAHVVDGNHRYLAAVRAGVKTVPVIRRSM